MKLFNLLKSKKENKQRLSYRITPQTKPFIRYQINDIYVAKMLATNPDRPDRRKLLDIYDYIMNDSHLSSQISVAINKVISKKAYFYNGITGNDINEKASAIILSQWFQELIIYIIESEFYGFSLIELYGDNVDNIEINLINRYYVSTDTKSILINGSIDGEKISYKDKEFIYNIIEVIHPNSLGSLLKAAPNVIYKFYARSDWSRASEKFGMPILHLKIDANSEAELEEAEFKAKNFGNDGYIVTQAGDDAKIIEKSNNYSHLIYLDNIKYCDEQISKIINGQVATSDMKGWTGASEVQERILNDFTFSRMNFVKYIINNKILPFLQYKNILSTTNIVFDYELFRNDNKQNDRIINSKKKIHIARHVKKIHHTKIILNDIEKLFKELLIEIYQQKKLDKSFKELWIYNYEKLKNAIKEGYESSYEQVDFATSDQEMLKNLIYNAGVFASFKNHAIAKDLVKLLKDDDGKLRSFYDFQKIARPLLNNYNIHWLQAEYNAATANARSAAKWSKALETKHLYPNIEYLPSRSAHPRDEHRELWGIIRPINDPFWDIHLPPSGWGCKCSYRVTDKNITPIPENLPTIPPEFSFNPGKEGKIFNENHPYFKINNDKLNTITHEAKYELMRYESRKMLNNIKENENLRKPVKIGNKVLLITKNTYTKNLRYDDFFFDRLNLLYNLRKVINESKYIGTKVVSPNEYVEDKWKKKKYIKQYHFYRYEKNGRIIQFEIEERYNKQLIIYNIHIIK